MLNPGMQSGACAVLARSVLAMTALTLSARTLTAAIVLFGPGNANAQYMSCESFLSLDASLRNLYLTGFVEGLSYNQLELTQLVSAQEKQKDLKREQQLALQVMRSVAANIAQGIPNGLTVQQVVDKLEELCRPDENQKTAFVNAYSQYSTGLRQAARVRMEQQQEAAQGAAAQPTQKPKAAAPPIQSNSPVSSVEKPAAVPTQKPAAAPPTQPQ